MSKSIEIFFLIRTKDNKKIVLQFQFVFKCLLKHEMELGE